MWLSDPENLFIAPDLRSPPEIPTLGADDLQLFSFPGCASDHGSIDTAYFDLLSLAEKERAQGIKSPLNRATFVQSRAHLRWLLGYHLGIPAQEVPLVMGAHGKPQHRDHGIQFNLSHSKDVIVMGMARGTEMGVDIEHPRSPRRLDALIREVFSVQEQRWFEGLDETEQQDLFLRGWTLKEAWVKTTGRGIAAGLSNVVIREDFQGFEALPEGDPADFHLYESSFLSARMALVHRGRPKKVHYYQGTIGY